MILPGSLYWWYREGSQCPRLFTASLEHIECSRTACLTAPAKQSVNLYEVYRNLEFEGMPEKHGRHGQWMLEPQVCTPLKGKQQEKPGGVEMLNPIRGFYPTLIAHFQDKTHTHNLNITIILKQHKSWPGSTFCATKIYFLLNTASRYSLCFIWVVLNSNWPSHRATLSWLLTYSIFLFFLTFFLSLDS